MIMNSFTSKVPSMIDDEYLLIDGEGSQPPTQPTSMGLCVYSCALLEILADILVTFYSPKLESNFISPDKQHNMLTQVLTFNSRLDRFLSSVPQVLKAHARSASGSQDGSFSQQREVLHRR